MQAFFKDGKYASNLKDTHNKHLLSHILQHFDSYRVFTKLGNISVKVHHLSTGEAVSFQNSFLTVALLPGAL